MVQSIPIKPKLTNGLYHAFVPQLKHNVYT